MLTRVRIENVVASTSLGAELDLTKIARSLPGAEYEPDQFPGLIYRLKEPKTAVLLFHSGKVVCTGGKSWKQVEQSIGIVSEAIRSAGQKVLAHPAIDVQNIVATSDVGAEINLTSTAITLGLDRVEYEPEQFPGLICRLDSPRVVLLLFGSGKLVCTGARRPADVALAVARITQELQGAGLLPKVRGAAEAPEEPPARKPGKPRAAPAEPTVPLAPGGSPARSWAGAAP